MITIQYFTHWFTGYRTLWWQLSSLLSWADNCSPIPFGLINRKVTTSVLTGSYGKHQIWFLTFDVVTLPYFDTFTIRSPTQMSFDVDYQSSNYYSNQHIASSLPLLLLITFDRKHNVSKQLFKAVVPCTIFHKRRDAKNNVGIYSIPSHVWLYTYTCKIAAMYVKGYEGPLTQFGFCCGIRHICAYSIVKKTNYHCHVVFSPCDL